MPRAALLSIHARVEGTEPSTWEDPSLVQLWGPRFSAYVVAARDLAVFSLGRLPDDAGARQVAEDLAARLARPPRRREDDLRRGGECARRTPQPAPVRRTDRHGPDPMGRRATADHLDRAATRGRSARRAPRARAPVPAHLRSHHARGVRSSGRGSRRVEASTRSTRSRRSLTPVRTPIGDAWILTRDEPTFRAVPGPAAPARLLPSGDAYFLLRGPIASSWSPTPTGVPRSGPLASGRVPSSSRARSSGRGDARRRRSPSNRGVVCRGPRAMRSRRRRSPCPYPVSRGASSSAGTPYPSMPASRPSFSAVS